jgi:hypothetical protein
MYRVLLWPVQRRAFFFANGERFGVDGTTPNPLLTITTPLGLQTGGVPLGSTIVNRGNLSVAADLTLVADRLDLHAVAEVIAGRELQRLGQE